MASLTTHDLSILSKIADPEAGPSAPLLIDSSLPKDPHITNPTAYQKITVLEASVISSLQKAELQLVGLQPTPENTPSPLSQYQTAIESFSKLIEENPNYASARNNRAQAIRRVYGDGLLVSTPKSTSTTSTKDAPPLDPSPSSSTLLSSSVTLLTDLTKAISLLTPKPYSPISPVAAKTLSNAYTQRGALYLRTAKLLSLKGSEILIENSRTEKTWSVVDFEEAASRDFMMGGRYGNEVAKALAVAANPTAKLCGEIVREAMVREFGGIGCVRAFGGSDGTM